MTEKENAVKQKEHIKNRKYLQYERRMKNNESNEKNQVSLDLK